MFRRMATFAQHHPDAAKAAKNFGESVVQSVGDKVVQPYLKDQVKAAMAPDPTEKRKDSAGSH